MNPFRQGHTTYQMIPTNLIKPTNKTPLKYERTSRVNIDNIYRRLFVQRPFKGTNEIVVH